MENRTDTFTAIGVIAATVCSTLLVVAYATRTHEHARDLVRAAVDVLVLLTVARVAYVRVDKKLTMLQKKCDDIFAAGYAQGVSRVSQERRMHPVS